TSTPSSPAGVTRQPLRSAPSAMKRTPLGQFGTSVSTRGRLAHAATAATSGSHRQLRPTPRCRDADENVSSCAPMIAWAAFVSVVLPHVASSASCPAGTVLVLRSTVTLGAAADADALAPVTRTLGGFCIDRTEVTATRYLACAASGACPPSAGTVSFPGY